MSDTRVAKIQDLRKIPVHKRPKPTTGQSAPERELPWAELSADEAAVVKLLDGSGEGQRAPRDVTYLVDAVDDTGTAGKLRVRNAMRRLVSCGWAERVDRGTYAISERGRKRLRRLDQ